MKLAALAFFLLMFFAHVTDDFDLVAGQPLSIFRDGPRGWLGYALFAALLLVSVSYIKALARSRMECEAILSVLGASLLMLVAATSSTGGFHLLCSLLLFALLFSYYGILLYRAEPIWLAAHLFVPIALALVVRFHSYGLWQKCFISYFVFLSAAHHHVLIAQLQEYKSSLAAARRGRSDKRRKVYRVGASREWARDKMHTCEK
jgi:hypothetical protein